jgi:hypothetical protein
VLPKMADHWLAEEYTPQRTPYVEHEFTRFYILATGDRRMLISADENGTSFGSPGCNSTDRTGTHQQPVTFRTAVHNE